MDLCGEGSIGHFISWKLILKWLDSERTRPTFNLSEHVSCMCLSVYSIKRNILCDKYLEGRWVCVERGA